MKTVRFNNPVYIGDPINAIKIYNEKEVDELILLDIYATREKRPPPFEFIQSITNECFMPLCYGGGVSSLEHVRTLFAMGVEKVAVNSCAEDLHFISQAAQVFGSQSIVASVDIKRTLFGRHQVRTVSGTKAASADPVGYCKRLENAGAGELLLNSIDRDGTWTGFDLEIIRMVTDSVNIPVIACGGAGSLDHIKSAVKQAGASAVAIGSMAVFQAQNLGVLINFPARADLERIFS